MHCSKEELISFVKKMNVKKIICCTPMTCRPDQREYLEEYSMQEIEGQSSLQFTIPIIEKEAKKQKEEEEGKHKDKEECF